MDIKGKVNNYFKKKSKFSIFSDFLFIAFIIALLIPQSRVEVIAFVNKIRVAIINPSVENSENTVMLSDKDYNWQVESLDGEKNLLADYKGKVIFLNLWATWCPPCIAEMPSIQDLYDKYKDNEQMVFLIVSNEKVEKVSTFMKKRGFTFPVQITHYQLPKPFYTESIPTTFLVSKSGKIVVKETGAANWGGEKMQKIVDDLIAE
ncbi:MAG: TlpA family protein disulfide reductase [Bacteroidetes bacterium]|nr:MAG: TlpA family protein disulfide reductase [Bacteroidota bacterium]